MEAIEGKQQGTVGFNWRTLLYSAAIAELFVLVAMGVAMRDRLPLGLAVVVALGLALLNYRSGVFGDIVLGLLFLDVAAWTLSAALVNIVYGEELMRLLFPAALAAISSAGAVAAVAALVWRKQPEAGGEAPRLVGLVAGAFFALAVVTGFVVGRDVQADAQPVTPATALTLATENMAFSTPELVTDAGQVTVVVDNHDLWWHTFTIDALDVNVRLPSSGKRESTFTAEPGVYTYYCTIPGHEQLGMHGTLTVR